MLRFSSSNGVRSDRRLQGFEVSFFSFFPSVVPQGSVFPDFFGEHCALPWAFPIGLYFFAS